MSSEHYLAHLYFLKDGKPIIQMLSNHCEETGKYAADDLRELGLSSAAYLAGLLHDAGKYQDSYQQYLRDAAEGKAVKRGSVIHTFQGCRFLLENYHGTSPATYDDITSELLSFAVGAHHGLFDCINLDKKSGFQHRLQTENIDYKTSISRFFEDCKEKSELDALFAEANQQMISVFNTISTLVPEDGSIDEDVQEQEMTFYFGLLARLLLSAVIDGDRHSTSDFMERSAFIPIQANRKLWEQRLAYLEYKLSSFPTDSDIQKVRNTISVMCRDAGRTKPGVFRLNIPTGAGKTISSLRFALAHAVEWNKKRIIYTSPLLSILEQNAGVIRDFIGDNNIILEHHSNIIQENFDSEELSIRELLTESWNAPIIITTMVQLLNTMFDGKTTAIRRFQALANSIIIIDEVQTIPTNMLSLFNLTVNFLSKICNTTIVLCSATQPCFEKADHPIRVSVRDVVPYDEILWQPFKRTEIIDAGSFCLEEIPPYVMDLMEQTNSLLIVCNKRTESEFLFRHLSDLGFRCFHLSASMCVQHRRDTLTAVETALYSARKTGEKLICVSTQVIEAGVDISFERVIRFCAGIDNIIQSAGRCNRNGESLIPATVDIIRCTDEKLNRLIEIERAKTATIELLNAYRNNPVVFQNSLASNESVNYYYSKLYRNMPLQHQDFTVSDNTVFSLLSRNLSNADGSCESYGRYYLNQAFQTAGRLFRVFDSNTTDVIVPYGKGIVLINDLCAKEETSITPTYLKQWLEKAKPYTISLYDYQIKNLEPNGIYDIAGVRILQNQYYNLLTGFTEKSNRFEYWEV